jgi:DNA topoisomerase-3
MGRPFAAIIKLSEIPEDDKDYPNAGFKLEFDFGNAQDDETEAVDFTGRQALGVCPKCSGAVYEDGMRYVCENNTGPSKSCDFKTGKVVLQQEVSAEQVQKLLKEGKTDLLTNFKSNRTGRGFKAYLALDSAGKIGFEFEAKAPKAEGAAKAPAKKRAGASAATKSAAKPKRASKAKSSSSS